MSRPRKQQLTTPEAQRAAEVLPEPTAEGGTVPPPPDANLPILAKKPQGFQKGHKHTPPRGSPHMFQKGNKLSKGGNPYVAQVQKFRAILYSSATDAELRKIARNLINGAKNDSPFHLKEFYERWLGKTTQPILIEDARPMTREEEDAAGAKLLADMLAMIEQQKASVTVEGEEVK